MLVALEVKKVKSPISNRTALKTCSGNNMKRFDSVQRRSLDMKWNRLQSCQKGREVEHDSQVLGTTGKNRSRLVEFESIETGAEPEPDHVSGRDRQAQFVVPVGLGLGLEVPFVRP